MSKFPFLFFLLVAAFMVSCDPDKPVDPKPDPNDSCMEFKDLDSYFNYTTRVDFLNPNEGWAVGVKKGDFNKTVLVKTNDGGSNWSMVNEDLGILGLNATILRENIQFLDANKGFLLLENAAAGKLELAYTTDKGATWTTYPQIEEDKYPSFFSGIGSNSTHTMFLGKQYNTPFYLLVNNQTMEIESYHEVGYDQDNIDAFQVEAATTGFHYSEDGVLTVIAQTQDQILNEFKMVAMQTTDNGIHWDIRKEFDFEGAEAGCWVNDDLAFVSGPQYINNESQRWLYKTVDGGLTWTKQAIEQEFTDIDFLDENHGIGITAFHIYLTEDGGMTWSDKDCIDGRPRGTACYIGVDNAWANGVGGGNEGLYHYTGQ